MTVVVVIAVMTVVRAEMCKLHPAQRSFLYDLNALVVTRGKKGTDLSSKADVRSTLQMKGMLYQKPTFL